MQKIKNRGLRLLLGAVGAAGLFGTISFQAGENSEVIFTNSFLSAWFCILSALLFDAVCKKLEKKSMWQTGIGIGYSLFLALALNIGKQLETVENLNVGQMEIWFNVLLLTVYFSPFVCVFWQWLEKRVENHKTAVGGQKRKKRDFYLYWLLIFVCWIPVFLAFYPGAFVYDAYEEYIQVAKKSFTTHHPLLHVLILGEFVCKGKELFDSYNIGIAAYTLCQMLFLSGVFSYTITYLKQKGLNKVWTFGAFMFYAFFPVIPMYAVCSSKDTWFTACFLVVLIKMLQFWEEPQRFWENKGNIAAGIFFSLLMMLLRNNGIYAYLVWIPVMVIGGFLKNLQKNDIYKMIFMMVISVILSKGCLQVLTVITHADNSEKQEIMTVPIQQLVRTYRYAPEAYSEEEKELLFTLIPEEDMHLYNARLSDLVKSKFNNREFGENPAKYLKLWIKIGLRKPMIYLNAWLMTSYGYWYPDAVINVYGGHQKYTFMYEDSSYFGFETEEPGTRESKFPWLEEQYRKMSLELYQQKVPGLSMLFSPGFMFWVFMFGFGYFLQKKSWNKVLPFTGVLLLWLTVILGPTYLVRYVLILWFAMPVLWEEVLEV